MSVRSWQVRVEGMSRERVMELRYFCLQYPAKRARLDAARGGFNRIELDGQPRGSGRIGRPTEARALRALDSLDRRDVRMIEDAARDVSGGSDAVWRALMRHVTRGERLEAIRPPMGRNQFYAIRRQFFIRLDRRMIGDAGTV